MIDEHLLLSGVNRKAPQAWKDLYDDFYAALCVYTGRIIGKDTAVEDLVQEVFVAVWHGDRKFGTLQELTRYLYRACYNNSLLYIRNNRIHDSILNRIGEGKDFTADDVFAMTVREEVTRQLYCHINSLPAEQKKVILLSIEGYSWEEIAERLGVSVNTVKTHKARGFRSLRTKLQDAVWLFLL